MLARDLNILSHSVVQLNEVEIGFSRQEGIAQIVVTAPPGSAVFADFEGTTAEQGVKSILVGEANAKNLAVLRKLLSWLKPVPLGLRTSAGMGDRLGLATPGHVRAVRSVGGDIAPIFAQQSIREMTRTQRTAQQVLDEATWGVFEENWTAGFGADADHLKTPANIDTCVAAGFTFYTVDPGEYVNDGKPTLDALKALPWDTLHDSIDALRHRYLDQPFDVESQRITFDDETLLGAAVKYGRVVAHVLTMYNHLIAVTGGQNCELEISVDETETVTTHAEHFYIANELKRLGVKWVSLAPRYIGRFEKGVDYIGDLAEFKADFAVHAAIARQFGPYKLSLHSGSDKFAIYPIAMEATGGLVHLKTAGTSYLEALRTIAALDPVFFRQIYVFACDHYATDRASYHVSALVGHAPLPEQVTDSELPALFDQFDARQIMHVTFGSVLTSPQFHDQFMTLLRTHPEEYAANLEKHFQRHLAPFAKTGLS